MLTKMFAQFLMTCTILPSTCTCCIIIMHTDFTSCPICAYMRSNIIRQLPSNQPHCNMLFILQCDSSNLPHMHWILEAVPSISILALSIEAKYTSCPIPWSLSVVYYRTRVSVCSYIHVLYLSIRGLDRHAENTLCLIAGEQIYFLVESHILKMQGRWEMWKCACINRQKSLECHYEPITIMLPIDLICILKVDTFATLGHTPCDAQPNRNLDGLRLIMNCIFHTSILHHVKEPWD